MLNYVHPCSTLLLRNELKKPLKVIKEWIESKKDDSEWVIVIEKSFFNFIQ